MHVLFRVDASQQIGTGHVARCLTLAAALRERGASCTFVARHMPDTHAAAMRDRGFDLLRLDAADAADAGAGGDVHPWLGVAQEQDADEVLARVSGRRFDWVIVDHYALDARWERKLRSVAGAIMVIDDIADRMHDCDVLLDQNLHADMQGRYASHVPTHCRLLLGPHFALLRPEFAQARAHARPRTGRVRRLLVFFGGMDSIGGTLSALDAVGQIDLSDACVDVVIGAHHPRRQEIETRCRALACELHVQTERMAELMLAADLSIGAGGSATWERCCMGLPSLVFATADNQVSLVRHAARAGLVYAPDVELTDTGAVRLQLQCLLSSPSLLAGMSERAMDAVDGSGVRRVLRELGLSAVSIRPARISDMRDVFEWRNHASVRQVSRSTAVIAWPTHQAWFEAVLQDPARRLLIGQSAGAPVGVVRLDIAGRDAEVSIYVVAGHDGKGLGSDLLLAAEAWVRRHAPEVESLQAVVLGENVRSHSLFTHAGYRPSAAHYAKRLDS